MHIVGIRYIAAMSPRSTGGFLFRFLLPKNESHTGEVKNKKKKEKKLNYLSRTMDIVIYRDNWRIGPESRVRKPTLRGGV